VEHLACVMYPLSTSISFEGITNNVTRVSRVKLPLSKFHTIRSDEEDDVQFLAMVELEAESVVGGESAVCGESAERRCTEPGVQTGWGGIRASTGA
jgi:hypothetical protein